LRRLDYDISESEVGISVAGAGDAAAAVCSHFVTDGCCSPPGHGLCPVKDPVLSPESI
jgi:hypothetical protein